MFVVMVFCVYGDVGILLVVWCATCLFILNVWCGMWELENKDNHYWWQNQIKEPSIISPFLGFCIGSCKMQQYYNSAWGKLLLHNFHCIKCSIKNNNAMRVDVRNLLKFCKDILSTGELLGIQDNWEGFYHHAIGLWFEL